MTTAQADPSATQHDAVEGDVVETGMAQSPMNAATRAEVDVQISTAKRYPRTVNGPNGARAMAMSMAVASEDVAASCCYTLKRQGKPIKGGSVRLAEIMVQAWGNIRAETRVLQPDALTIESESVVWDLERNVAVRSAVKRRITNKEGRRYNDDMIVMTGNAAASIAFRNAVFRVIPKTFVNEVYDACESVAVGDIKTLGDRRAKALAYFARFGVNAADVCKKMGRDSVDSLTLDDVAQLKAMAEAVKRGEATIESVFAEEAPAQGVGDIPKGRSSFVDKKTGEVEGDGAAPASDEIAKQSAELDQKRAAMKKADAQRARTGCREDLLGCCPEMSQGPDGKMVCANHAFREAGEPSEGKVAHAPQRSSAEVKADLQRAKTGCALNLEGCDNPSIRKGKNGGLPRCKNHPEADAST